MRQSGRARRARALALLSRVAAVVALTGLACSCDSAAPPSPTSGTESPDHGGVRGPSVEPRDGGGDVVLILIDTLRRDRLPFYGYRESAAPFLAALGAKSARFTWAWATSSWTAPATASIFTARYPFENGVTEGFFAHERRTKKLLDQDRASVPINVLPTTSPTLPELFRERGYRTFGVSSNINIGPEIGFARGFDRFERLHRESAEALVATLSAMVADEPEDAPRFFYLHLNDVHGPYERHERWYRPASPSERDRTVAAYESELGYVDDVLARAFGEFGWDTGTAIVLVTDHGEEFWDHGGTGHGLSLYPELTRIAFSIHAPHLGVKPGDIDVGASGIDVLPTLWDLVGGAPRPEWTGQSLAALARGAGRDARGPRASRPLVLHRVKLGANATELWGLVRGSALYIEGPDARELFDLAADPGATADRAELDPAVADGMRDRLARVRAAAASGEATPGQYELDAALVERLRELGYAD